ncbi:peptidoglycan transglycosylase, partial [bacterium]
FRKHRGFSHASIRGAIIANLKARRFVRGASTISMQLSKNLFLGREKTLSRKLEEVLLTTYLEQVFDKDALIELYLNVVEFGPDLYGITDAAEHYFGRSPNELNLAEAFFLASLLPSPLRYHRMYEKGEVSPGWLRHLHQLMEISEQRGALTSGELAEGLAAPIVFYKGVGARPEPRSPAAPERRHRAPGVDWQEAE